MGGHIAECPEEDLDLGFEHFQNASSGGIEVTLKSGTAKHYSQLSFSGFTGCEIAFLCQDASVLLCLQPLGELHGLQGSE